jgi:hypothetical protein
MIPTIVTETGDQNRELFFDIVVFGNRPRCGCLMSARMRMP